MGDGDSLPEAWQWLYFLTEATQSALGPDGHEKRGVFLPPVAAPRRMFAGAKAVYHKPLVFGHPAELTEKIESIVTKEGRTGPLVIVRIGRHMVQSGTLAIEEEQTIVYRKAPQPGGEAARREVSSVKAEWRREVRVEPTLLFRFSAITFNAHRIHYDRNYSCNVEGYPGLVVHGPLIALLLLEEARHRNNSRGFSELSFRSIRPLFDTAPFQLCGRIEGSTVAMWAEAMDGSVALRADARLSELDVRATGL
ncbi:MAG TPA: hypothetical protein VIY90_09280 [Steroidobacteraceae bacterium]